MSNSELNYGMSKIWYVHKKNIFFLIFIFFRARDNGAKKYFGSWKKLDIPHTTYHITYTTYLIQNMICPFIWTYHILSVDIPYFCWTYHIFWWTYHIEVICYVHHQFFSAQRRAQEKELSSILLLVVCMAAMFIWWLSIISCNWIPFKYSSFFIFTQLWTYHT